MIVMWIAIVVVLIFGCVVFWGAPYVPSQKRYVSQALKDLYPLGTSDVLVDVGSGDGVVLRLASALGARAVGYELNPILVLISRILSRKDKRVSVVLADFWHASLPQETTVVYSFAVTRDSKKTIKKIQSEVDRIGHPIALLSYGNTLPGLVAEKSLAAYHLYAFYPLQSN